MNVLLITWHDLGCHLGCYGRTDVRSPRLDQLAREGARLETFFATNPICSPARGSLMSGLYPHRHGLQGLAHQGWSLNPGVRLVEEIFGDAGYHTSLIGHQHERRPATDCPCDDLWVESTKAAKVVPQACQRLEQRAAEGRPFFMRVGFSEVHRPLAEESDEGWESVELMPFLLDTEEHRRQVARYNHMIERADRELGVLLDKLDSTGLAETTVVVFVTDHGVPFPGAKLTLYDAGLKIAGIIRAPGVIPEGTVVSELLSGVDLLPTLLDLCQVESAAACDGQSFAGALTGGESNPREAIFAGRAMPVLMRCVREERFKYILNFDEQNCQRLMGNEELRTSICMALTEPLRRKNPTEELFDLARDPQEQQNLAGSSEHAADLERLRNRLRQWMKESDDPVLRRDVLPPAFETAWNLIRSEP